MRRRVKLNIRGEIFDTFASTLKRYPETLLGQLNKRSQFYSKERKQYEFDRSRPCFVYILYFYQTSILSPPLDIPIQVFVEECEYFQLPQHLVEKIKVKGGILPCQEPVEEWKEDREEYEPCHRLAWNILENPERSIAARCIAIFSLCVILLSILIACLETVEILGIEQKNWATFELITNCWFLVELLLRFIVCPNKCLFLTEFSNWVDGIAVVPYFTLLLCVSGRVKSLGFIRIFRFVRVLRLFRLSKQNKRVHIFQEVMKASVRDFQMLLALLSIETILVGSIMYHIEFSSNDQFFSIPESMWWCLVTLTSVGYGDIAPITSMGKFISGWIMMFGAATMTLPICSVASTFEKVYCANTEHRKHVR